MRAIKIDDLPDFDPAEHLRNNEEIAAYLSAVIGEDDPDERLHALGVAARARGMTEIARETGLAREALYRALRKGAATRLDTVSRVCKALGLRLTATSVLFGVQAWNRRASRWEKPVRHAPSTFPEP